jgi:hypothetical protein
MDQNPSQKRGLVAVVACVTALVTVVVLLNSLIEPKPLMERAQAIRIGQHISEVEQIMGSTGFVRKVGNLREIRCFGPMQTAMLEASRGVQSATGQSVPQPVIDDWPVVVQFDPRNGRVFRIKRGDEVVGTTHAP